MSRVIHPATKGLALLVAACCVAGLSLRVVAIERGDLQDLFFDNRVLWNHRALAAVLGVILRLPPIKRAMASQQVKSHYLETLITRLKV